MQVNLNDEMEKNRCQIDLIRQKALRVILLEEIEGNLYTKVPIPDSFIGKFSL